MALFAVIWLLMPAEMTVQSFAAWFEPHRRAWYALPGVAAAFVGLGLLMVPVLLLIAATGVAFGPWLGPVYAMAGCLASASTGFAIGRWLGLERLEHVGGRRLTRIAHAMARNGTLAVFLLRKIPLPFVLSNVVAGAARVRYRDFIVGTTLGMAAAVVALAGFGYQAAGLIEDPSPRKVALAALALGIPLTSAWLINRALKRRRAAA
ncbi:MAG TPA: VTT domain-containing protein [Vicinamibacterales bacterium]|nr:VTT domain-containing protein [Vicinamibacterales bacterium]